MDDGLDKNGETIICARQFFRDIKNRHGKVETIGLTKGHLKNVYFHFGSLVLHPSRNLILHEEEQAATSYGNWNYASFPKSFSDVMFEIPYELKEYGEIGVRYKHLQRVRFQGMLDPTYCEREKSAYLKCVFEMDGVEASGGLKTGFKWKIEGKLGVYDSQNETNGDRLRSDVYRITDKERGRFMELYETAFTSPYVVSEIEKPKGEEPFWVESELRTMKRREASARRQKIEVVYDLQEDNKKKLYLMKDNHSLAYKIGVSANPKYRESTLQSEKPSIEIVGRWDNLSSNEKLWHRYFNKERLRGEWFKLTPQQVRFFVHRCKKDQGPPHDDPQIGSN